MPVSPVRSSFGIHDRECLTPACHICTATILVCGQALTLASFPPLILAHKHPTRFPLLRSKIQVTLTSHHAYYTPTPTSYAENTPLVLQASHGLPRWDLPIFKEHISSSLFFECSCHTHQPPQKDIIRQLTKFKQSHHT